MDLAVVKAKKKLGQGWRVERSLQRRLPASRQLLVRAANLELSKLLHILHSNCHEFQVKGDHMKALHMID